MCKYLEVKNLRIEDIYVSRIKSCEGKLRKVFLSQLNLSPQKRAFDKQRVNKLFLYLLLIFLWQNYAHFFFPSNVSLTILTLHVAD